MRFFTFPAPTGGWNARDAISSMGKTDARELTNWVVTADGVKIRPGRRSWATGLGAPVESLMEWAPSSGNPKLFGAVQSSIYDATAGGAVGAAVQTGLSNGRWQHVNFGTPGGNYLVAVNGQDAPRNFDGTAWNSPTITGSGGGVTLNANNLVSVMVHMNRLWFIEKGTRRVWYLPVQSISGTASLFDLTSLCRLGGELVAMDTWTRDGGTGTDDYAAFLTSKGEVLVYSGVDPSANTTWGLVGIFKIAEPIGRRCTFKLGAELLVLTSQGPLPLSVASGLSEASQSNKAITDKISGAFETAYAACGTSFGWQILEHPRTGLLIVNVPLQERTTQEQYVFGEKTGAWQRFTGFGAGCFSLMGTDLFYGGNDGTVWKVDGFDDAGLPILATYRHAFLDLGSPLSKIFQLARPRMKAPPGFVPAVQIRTDFDESPIDYIIISARADGDRWDSASWDEARWGSDNMASQIWQGVAGSGTTASVAFRVAGLAPVALNGVDVTFEAGGYL